MNKIFSLCVAFLLTSLYLSGCACATESGTIGPIQEDLQKATNTSIVTTEQSPSGVVTDNTEHSYELIATSPSVRDDPKEGVPEITTEQTSSGVLPDNAEHSYETTPTSPAATDDPNEDMPTVIQNRLTVNGYSLTEASYMSFTSHGAMVPFVAVLEKLGAEIIWENDCTATIVFAEKQYFLDTSVATLIRDGDETNCLIPAPGSSVHHQTVDGVFVLDHITTRTALMIMGMMIDVEVDYKNNTVIINS